MRVGLSRVFGLARGDRRAHRRARARERPFASLADFVDRVRPTLPELESLILAGALDWTGRTRPSLLLEARAGAARVGAGAAPRGRAPALAAPDGAALLRTAPRRRRCAVPELPEFDLAERVRGECARDRAVVQRRTRSTCWSHPRRGAARCRRRDVERHAGRRVAVVGLPCASRRVETKQGGDSMLFLTLADRSGLAECVLFPDAYRALRRLAARRVRARRGPRRRDARRGDAQRRTGRAAGLISPRKRRSRKA